MMRLWVGIMRLFVIIVPAVMVSAAEQEDWEHRREADYAKWRVEHQDWRGAAGQFTERMSLLAAEAKPLQAGPEFDDIAAKSKALTPAQKKSAQSFFKTGFDAQAIDPEKAESAFRQGLDIDPGNGLANFYFAELLRKRGNRTEAADYYRRTRELAPNSDEAIEAGLALQLLPQAKYGGLAAISRNLSPARRSEAQELLKAGFDFAQTENYAAAELAFRKGLQIDPGNGRANYYLASVLLLSGDEARAAEYFRRAIELSPGTDEAIKASETLAKLPPMKFPPPVWHAGDRLPLVWDGPFYPQLVVLPPQSFKMGSTANEAASESLPFALASQEQPQHEVVIVKPFAIGKFPVTVGEFSLFLRDTGYDMSSGCNAWNGSEFVLQPDLDWQHPGFVQSEDSPVVCVSYRDARAYIAWLNGRVGQVPGLGLFRLPSEAEWEYAARAGTQTARWWGDEIGSANANCSNCGSAWDNRTSPVGSFPANAFGLHDMLGNAWQWTEDCWHDTYDNAPKDGTAWGAMCGGRVLRGGSWLYRAKDVRAARRLGDEASDRNNNNGFRLARTMVE